MRCHRWTNVLLLITPLILTLPLLGCSRREREVSAALADSARSATNELGGPVRGVMEMEPATTTPHPGEDANTVTFSPPFPGTWNLFAPPAEIPSLELEPAESHPAPPGPGVPPLRLLGFVKVDQPRALLDVDGQITLVSAGDVIQGIEVVEVSYPELILRHDDNELVMNLFQPQLPSTPLRAVTAGSPRRRGAAGAEPATAPMSPSTRGPMMPPLPTPPTPHRGVEGQLPPPAETVVPESAAHSTPPTQQ